VSLELREKSSTIAAALIRAADGVSLTISRDEFLAPYEPSGSSKTTLLQLIAAILAPDASSISFECIAVTTLSPRERALYLRRHVGRGPDGLSDAHLGAQQRRLQAAGRWMEPQGGEGDGAALA
jgi:ABC-type iron transport system FetAB ATPase subunit